jgi:hypothetical protein
MSRTYALVRDGSREPKGSTGNAHTSSQKQSYGMVQTGPARTTHVERLDNQLPDQEITGSGTGYPKSHQVIQVT